MAADDLAMQAVRTSAALFSTQLSWNILATPLEGDFNYRQVSNIRGTFVGNKIVDHWDVVGASPVGTAPTTSSF